MKPEGAAASKALEEAQETYVKMVSLLRELRKHLDAAVKDQGWPQTVKPKEKAAANKDADKGDLPGPIPRLGFEVCGVGLFIDFAVDVGESVGELDVSGRVICGALRPKGIEQDMHEKGLCEFTLSRHGLIEDPAGLHGKWHLSDAETKKKLTAAAKKLDADAKKKLTAAAKKLDAEAEELAALLCLMVKKVLPEGAQWTRRLRTADRG